MLSKNFDDSATIMARIRLARIALTKLQKAIFGTRRVALESKRIAYESLVLSLLLPVYGSECWVVSAENVRVLQRFHRSLKCIRIMCRVTRHHTQAEPPTRSRKQHISTEELEAKLGIHDIRHYAHARVLRYLGHVFRTYVWTCGPDSISQVRSGQVRPLHDSISQDCQCSAVGWWMASSLQVKPGSFYDSAVQKLLYEVGLSLLQVDAANKTRYKSEWHNNVAPCRGPRLLEAAARRKDLPDQCAARTAAVELLHI
jgi:hypothetical protein